MSPQVIWGVIIGMALLNFLIRFVPIAAVSRIELPAPVLRWLEFIPVSVMGALVANTVARPGGTFVAPWANPWVLACAATALAYRMTRSFLGATVIGMIAFVAVRAMLGA
jgi:branched-subunit amino acid transport protein